MNPGFEPIPNFNPYTRKGKALIAKVKEIVGDLPALNGPAPGPGAPAAPAAVADAAAAEAARSSRVATG